MLGEKKSEEPYTLRDRELLEAIATQMALVCEHLRLKERADEERQLAADMIARFSGRHINVLKECPRRGALSPALAAEWFDQVLEGLKTAHQRGVVHRDLKPENILVAGQHAERARLVLLDFGLAKMRALVASDPRMLTTEGVVLGTLGYMSPEQLTGLDTDERTDVFSFGVILVEALTGQRPFPSASYVEGLISILHETVELPGTAPEIRRLNDVLQRCLAKERTMRFSSAAALQSELIPAIRGCEGVFTAVGVAGRGEMVSSAVTTAPVSRSPTP